MSYGNGIKLQKFQFLLSALCIITQLSVGKLMLWLQDMVTEYFTVGKKCQDNVVINYKNSYNLNKMKKDFRASDE